MSRTGLDGRVWRIAPPQPHPLCWTSLLAAPHLALPAARRMPRRWPGCLRCPVVPLFGREGLPLGVACCLIQVWAEGLQGDMGFCTLPQGSWRLSQQCCCQSSGSSLPSRCMRPSLGWTQTCPLYSIAKTTLGRSQLGWGPGSGFAPRWGWSRMEPPPPPPWPGWHFRPKLHNGSCSMCHNAHAMGSAPIQPLPCLSVRSSFRGVPPFLPSGPPHGQRTCPPSWPPRNSPSGRAVEVPDRGVVCINRRVGLRGATPMPVCTHSPCPTLRQTHGGGLCGSREGVHETYPLEIRHSAAGSVCC